MATGTVNLKENVTKGAKRIADALRNVQKTGVEADKALDKTFKTAGKAIRRGYGGGGGNKDRDRDDPEREAKDLSAAFERSSKDIIRNDKNLTNQLKISGEERRKLRKKGADGAFDMSAAFEKSAKDTIRQDRHLTNLSQEEDKKRAQNEQKAVNEIDKTIKDGNKKFVNSEKSRFADNKRLREADLKDGQQKASKSIDSILKESNQSFKARDSGRKKELASQKRHRDQERKGLESQLKFRKNYNKQHIADQKNLAKQVNSSRRQIEVGLLELFFTLHSLNKPITQLTESLVRFTLGNIRAGAEVEKFASTLKIVSGDSAVAKKDLERLLDITIELAAIDTPGLIQFSARLQTAGLTALQAEKAIVGVTKRMEEQGKSASETRRVLEQLTQAVNSNIISMQDFRPILREYPRLYQDFSQALGTTVTDLDSLRKAANAAGGATAAIIRTFEHVSEVAQGADINTINKQLDALKDRVFVLRAALGQSLQPIIIGILKQANKFIDFLSGANESVKIFTATLIIFASVLGKFVSGAINVFIATIAYFQLRAAIDQVSVMTANLNAMRVATLGANAATIEIPKHTLNSVNALRIMSKWALRAAIGIAAIGIAVSTLLPLILHLTKQSRLAREEYDTFIKTILKIPDSISQGNVAIKRQIEELREFRLELLKLQDDSQIGFLTTGGRGTNATEQRALIARKLLSGLRQPLNAAEERFLSLQKQVEKTDSNIGDLNIVLEEGEDRFDALRRVMKRTQEQLDKAITEKDKDKARRLQLAIDSLVLSFRRFYKDAQRSNSILKGTAENLIAIDYQIRILERTKKSLGQLGDIFIGFDVGEVKRNAEATITLLEKEAELKKRLLELEESDEKKKALEVIRIDAQLDFDRRTLREDAAKKTKELNSAIFEAQRKSSRLITQSNYEAEQQRHANRLYWANRRRQLDKQLTQEELGTIKQSIGFQIQELQTAFKGFEVGEIPSLFDPKEVSRNIEQTVELYKRAAAFEISIIRQSESNKRISNEKVKSVRQKLTNDIAAIRKEGFKKESELEQAAADESKRLLDATTLANYEAGGQQHANRLYWAGRRRELEKESSQKELQELQRNEQARRLLIDNSRAAVEGRDTAEENRERLSEILELSAVIQKEAEKNQKELSRISKNFGRGLSRSITDFLYEGETGFADFVKAFAKNSTRIILQAKINAGIQKFISDDLTRHQIINIQKVAAAQIATGVNAQNITPAQVAAASPALGLSATAIGSFALAGLVIAPFLVRAIQEGFSDTKVELDGREVGKANSKSARRLAREGRIRI